MIEPKLKETMRSLWNENSKSSYSLGVNLNFKQSNNLNGLVIGNETFSPDKHSLDSLNVLASELSEIDQADIVLPFRNLIINSILIENEHKSSNENSLLKAIDLSKDNASKKFHKILKSSMFFINSHKEYSIYPKQDKKIPKADISFLIGKYENFLDQDDQNLKLNNSRKIINVILAHPLDLELPPKAGVIYVGNGMEVNTHKTKQLNKFNHHLNQQKENLLEKQRAKYGRVALIMTTEAEIGFNVQETDKQIASLIKQKIIR